MKDKIYRLFACKTMFEKLTPIHSLMFREQRFLANKSHKTFYKKSKIFNFREVFYQMS